MADEGQSFQEKTEEATPKRRSDARDEGQVARSQELASGAVLGAGLGAILIAGPWMKQQLMTHLGERLQIPSALTLDLQTAPELLRESGTIVVLVLAPLLLAVAACSLLVNFAQVGMMFTTKPLVPDWGRMNPIKGIANMFTLRTLSELIKNLLKVALVGLAVWMVLHREVPILRQLVFLEPAGLLAALGAGTLRVVAWALAMLLVLALADIAFQRWDLSRRLKMSLYEVKQEMRQTEGDPLLKRRQRSIQLETAYNRMIRDLPLADVVVTNPVHLAVALKYDSANMRAPRVLAKGRRLVAERIKAIAREHGIPVLEDKPLARALFKSCDVGGEIPGDLYRAVAELLAFVYRTRQRRSA